MDIFSQLNKPAKYLLIATVLVLLSAAVGLLLFGDNMVNYEANLFIEHAKEAAKSDMIYIEPEAH